MKKILTIGILMGIVAINGEKTMASTGAAYTGYVIEKSNAYIYEKSPRKAAYEASKLETALRNHR